MKRLLKRAASWAVVVLLLWLLFALYFRGSLNHQAPELMSAPKEASQPTQTPAPKPQSPGKEGGTPGAAPQKQ
jgi:hypothetical protein